jgi:hypothetical protein
MKDILEFKIQRIHNGYLLIFDFGNFKPEYFDDLNKLFIRMKSWMASELWF